MGEVCVHFIPNAFGVDFMVRHFIFKLPSFVKTHTLSNHFCLFLLQRQSGFM
uniref:Uncharacterized protein n=1 Tax=Anguilla anguilla TaxID=7936 RepID=A0A0E9T7S5_ANGAN